MTQRSKGILEWSLLTIVALCALVLAVMLSYQQVYAGKIYKNVHFGSIDLSGKTKKQAEKILAKEFESLTKQEFIISSGDKELKAKIEDTGLSFDSNEIINSIYDTGRNAGFWNNLKNSSKTLMKKTIIEGRPDVNEVKYKSFIDITVKQLDQEPIDASLAIVDGEIKYIESKDGQVVDTSKLIEEVVSLVTSSDKKIILGSTLIQAKVKSADFAVAKKQTEDLLNKNITFNYQGKSYQPNKKEIGAWIVFANNSGQFSASIDDTNAKAYMNKIARNFEAKKIDRKITDSGEVLQAGREGVYLDKDATLNSLKSLLAQSQIAIELPVVKEAPKEIKVNITNGVETGRYEGKYIDINLSTQRFCRVDGVNLIDCLITSTGKPSMPTPTGDFKVLNKIPMAWSSIYHLYMPWWQQINGPIGIHELVMWPDGTKEDVSHLGQTVSHGCIRLGPGTAEMIFNWTEIGTPVYVHK